MSMLLWGYRQCNWRAPVVLHGLSRAAVGEWPDDEDWRFCSRWGMHTLSLSHNYKDIRTTTHTHTHTHTLSLSLSLSLTLTHTLTHTHTHTHALSHSDTLTHTYTLT